MLVTACDLSPPLLDLSACVTEDAVAVILLVNFTLDLGLRLC